MAAAVVSMNVRPAGDGAGIIDIKGDVTSSCEGLLGSAYDELTASGAKKILLDFTGLEYMNSGGIGMIVTMLVRANRQRQSLLAYGLTDHYRQIFELTRLDEAITIVDDETAALAAAGVR
ncbi:MAG: STAS domain-containing protein [Actinomycetota bacterium]|nr:STAS domain-containing protein [Actinomycetota bacterium]